MITNKIVDRIIQQFVRSAKKSLHTTSYRGIYQPDCKALKSKVNK